MTNEDALWTSEGSVNADSNEWLRSCINLNQCIVGIHPPLYFKSQRIRTVSFSDALSPGSVKLDEHIGSDAEIVKLFNIDYAPMV